MKKEIFFLGFLWGTLGLTEPNVLSQPQRDALQEMALSVPGFSGDSAREVRALVDKLSKKSRFDGQSLMELQKLLAEDFPWNCESSDPRLVRNFHQEGAEIFHRLSPDEKKMYRDIFEPEAQKKLNFFAEKGWEDGIIQVARAFRGTKAASEALQLLLRVSWDQIRPEASALYSLVLLNDAFESLNQCDRDVSEALPVMNLAFAVTGMLEEKGKVEALAKRCQLELPLDKPPSPSGGLASAPKTRLYTSDLLQISFRHTPLLPIAGEVESGKADGARDADGASKLAVDGDGAIGGIGEGKSRTNLEWGAISLLGYPAMEQLVRQRQIAYSRGLFCAGKESQQHREIKLIKHLAGWCQWSLLQPAIEKETVATAHRSFIEIERERHSNEADLKDRETAIRLPISYWDAAENFYFLEASQRPLPIFQSIDIYAADWREILSRPHRYWPDKTHANFIKKTLLACFLRSPIPKKVKKDVITNFIKSPADDHGSIFEMFLKLINGSPHDKESQSLLKEVISTEWQSEKRSVESPEEWLWFKGLVAIDGGAISLSILKQAMRNEDSIVRSLAMKEIHRRDPQLLDSVISEVVAEKGEAFLLDIPTENSPWVKVLLQKHQPYCENLLRKFELLGSSPKWISNFSRALLSYFPESDCTKFFFDVAISRRDDLIVREYFLGLPVPLPSWMNDERIMKLFSLMSRTYIGFLARLSQDVTLSKKFSKKLLGKLISNEFMPLVRSFAFLSLSRIYSDQSDFTEGDALKASAFSLDEKEMILWEISEILSFSTWSKKDLVAKVETTALGVGRPVIQALIEIYENRELNDDPKGQITPLLNEMTLSEKIAFLSAITPKGAKLGLPYGSFLFPLWDDQAGYREIERFWHYAQLEQNADILVDFLNVVKMEMRHAPKKRFGFFNNEIPRLLFHPSKEVRMEALGCFALMRHPEKIEILKRTYYQRSESEKMLILRSLFSLGAEVENFALVAEAEDFALKQLELELLSFSRLGVHEVLLLMEQVKTRRKEAIHLVVSFLDKEDRLESSTLFPQILTLISRLLERETQPAEVLTTEMVRKILNRLGELLIDKHYRIEEVTYLAIHRLIISCPERFRALLPELKVSHPQVFLFLNLELR